MQKYSVRSIGTLDFEIKGDLSNSLWDKASTLSDFMSPWDAEDISKIEFRALHNSDKLFFSFKVFDTKRHIIKKDNSNASINDSDRVELFFRSDSIMSPYYCLEIDPTPRIMDFKALPNKQFDFDWSWPAGELEVKSEITENYFIVEGSISLSSLKKIGLLKKNTIEIGIFRAKYNEVKIGEFEPTWITWVDPNTAEPNFHTSTSFGLLELE
jgi:hypothetical protein